MAENEIYSIQCRTLTFNIHHCATDWQLPTTYNPAIVAVDKQTKYHDLDSLSYLSEDLEIHHNAALNNWHLTYKSVYSPTLYVWLAGYCLLIYKQSVVTPSRLNAAICHIVVPSSGMIFLLTLTIPSLATGVSLEFTTIVTVIGNWTQWTKLWSY